MIHSIALTYISNKTTILARSLRSSRGNTQEMKRMISSTFMRNSLRGQRPSIPSQMKKDKIIRNTHSSGKKLKNDDSSSVVDGLAASSTWRRGELSKLSDKFKDSDVEQDTTIENDGSNNIDEVDLSQPLQIDSDEDVQQMWKDMENRVTRRRSMTISQARMSGKNVGRNNLRKTDEEAWLEAGLYEKSEDNNK